MFGARASARSGAIALLDEEKELDRAVDAFAGILRVFGELSFDTDRMSAAELRTTCADMVQELLLGPTRRDEEANEEPKGGRRDFGRGRRFLEQRRREERDYVVRSSTNLRQALQAFAQCLNAAMAEDQADDARLELEVGRLVDVAASQDPEQMTLALGTVVSLVQSTVRRKREREKRQREDLGRRVVELKGELEVARTQAVIDPLTQLYNRAAFTDELHRLSALGVFLAGDPCLLLVDVDHFKVVNDTQGHPMGDRVLKAVADNIARHFMRREDFVARYGGEEFAVLARESTLERTIERAERMREAQRRLDPSTTGGSLPTVTVSVGIARIAPGEPPEHWLERADRALYDAKHAGRNCVRVAPTVAMTTIPPR
ncbi:MAG TPA: GGDEF domain-containing protein [Polyangiaceae bacterium]